MTLESIEKMRELQGCIDGYYKDEAGDLRTPLMDLLDALEREISERYMEKPEDGRGETISIGDVVDWFGDRFKVAWIEYETSGTWIGRASNGEVPTAIEPSECYVRTIEDVLKDALHDSYTMDAPSVVEKYSGELREMVGGAKVVRP